MLFRSQVGRDLQHFHFASEYQAGNLNEEIKSAAKYVFSVYQLATIAMRHSEDFENMQDTVMNILTQNSLENEQCETILTNLSDTIQNIKSQNADSRNYLIDTQLDLIERLIRL